MHLMHFMLGIFLIVDLCDGKTSRVTPTRQPLASPETFTPYSAHKTSPVFTTLNPSTLFPPSRATIQPDDSDCQDIATDFAYRNNLCAGATSPENYLSVSRSRYSCSMRCGQAPVYRAESSFVQCACDESCMAHKDCCPDMIELCPHQYNLGQSIAYPPNLHQFTKCIDHKQIFKRITLKRNSSSTAVNILSSPPTSSNHKGFTNEQRNLFGLTMYLERYSVIDLTTKLLYANFASFMAFKTADSTPYFIPRVARLMCSMLSAAAQGLPKVSEILPWCRVQGLGDSLTLYHRPCKKHYLLTCRCKDGHRLSDHVHNTCIGRNNPQAGQYRYPRWETQKFKVQQSATQVMATVFWDSREMILLAMLPKGESVNADRYCETLDWLRHAVRLQNLEWLEPYRWDIDLHPAHSPDLAPSDFYLFGSLKRHLAGQQFEDED
ncbi:histone-lysine N-methyltransferase SETMAR [Elysia marginata]|uniref:Histone-lysine N-methyltransferase SETMAR n=1 Tax=Elysia marginata TaxID=1093978 RepID=A0AAV4FXX4_9GAST|nr:histone-lysine N-methyltransferase SETMAR [Elysia marginata]